MREFQIFSGKNVDDAILAAQKHFGQERDKLEVEIVSGGSTGIFGLVGKKKAEIRARVRGGESAGPALAREDVAEPAPGEDQAESPAARAEQPREKKPGRGGRGQRPQRPAPAEEKQAKEKPVKEKPPRPERPRPDPAPAESGSEDEEQSGPAPVVETELTPELAEAVSSILTKLLGYITDSTPRVEVSGTAQRVTAVVYDEENSGLIIGREGQTLASLQYLVNRMVARRFSDPVRIQINTGEYREKQDENLRKMALYLADKAKSLGRPQSTKPLSSYHRRVVHMALQDDKTVQTRSKGEGAFKKVIILPRRKGDAPANG